MDEGGYDQAWLTLNEAKTSLGNARQERFDFLGYSFGVHWFEANRIRAKAQGARARQSPIYIRCHSSRTWRSVPPTLAPSGHVECQKSNFPAAARGDLIDDGWADALNHCPGPPAHATPAR